MTNPASTCASGEHTLVANAGEPIPNSRNDNGGKVHDRHDAHAPAVGYATVYPLAMFLRVLTAQLLILALA